MMMNSLSIRLTGRRVPADAEGKIIVIQDAGVFVIERRRHLTGVKTERQNEIQCRLRRANPVRETMLIFDIMRSIA